MRISQATKAQAALSLDWVNCAILAVMLPFFQTYAAAYDSYGGWLELKGKKTGFFQAYSSFGIQFQGHG